MRLNKKHSDALSGVLDTEELKKAKDIILDDAVRGWSIFDHDGVEVVSESVSETVTAVCSNAIDLTSKIGVELNESDEKPTMTFTKGMREMYAETFNKANMIVLRDKSNNSGREARHAR